MKKLLGWSFHDTTIESEPSRFAGDFFQNKKQVIKSAKEYCQDYDIPFKKIKFYKAYIIIERGLV